MKQPNIVIFSSDSMDGRVMGCMGHPAAHTPNMDRLAARGVMFRNAYCNYPLCCPSRASMWSGRYAHQIGAWNNLAASHPDVLADMGARLRNIVDYEALSADVEAVDRESSRRWRDGLGYDECRRVMSEKIYPGRWTDEQEQRVRAWLDEG